ncbi:MAG: trigger factor [Patescibacteria group bacterium]
MQASTKELKTGSLQLTVTLDHEDLAPYVSQAEKELASQIQVDGFRPGKVPVEEVRKRLDKETVCHTALEIALEKSLSLALDEKKIEARKVADLKIEENNADKLSYTITIHPFPDIKSIPELASVSVERKPVEVTQKEMEDALEVIRGSRSKFMAKDGPAESGDRVEVDFAVRLDGKVIDGGESKNHPLIIGGKSFLPGFEEALIGLKAGEEKEFALQVPADYFHKPIAGKSLQASVTVKSVQKVEKPELTDDFAKTLGSFNGLEDIRERVRGGIKEEKSAKERQRVRLAILDSLTEKAEITVSDSAINDQLEGMLDDFDRDLHSRGLELGMYLAHLGKTQDDIKKDWRKDAEKQVKIAAVLHKITKDNNISASGAEIDTELAQAVQSAAANGQLTPNQIDLGVLRRSVSDRIVTEKTLLFLENACVKA